MLYLIQIKITYFGWDREKERSTNTNTVQCLNMYQRSYTKGVRTLIMLRRRGEWQKWKYTNTYTRDEDSSEFRYTVLLNWNVIPTAGCACFCSFLLLQCYLGLMWFLIFLHVFLFFKMFYLVRMCKRYTYMWVPACVFSIDMLFWFFHMSITHSLVLFVHPIYWCSILFDFFPCCVWECVRMYEYVYIICFLHFERFCACEMCSPRLLVFFRTHKFIVKHIFDWSMRA